MKIRPAKREDLPAILEIYNDAVLTTTATYDYEPRSLEHRIKWFEDHEKINLPIFVAEEENGQIVGWSSLSRYHDRAGYRFTCENSIYVAASARGRGIGKLLLAPLIESARSLGLRAIIAAIDATNAASVRLHAGFDFVEVGRFPNVGFKFERWLDLVYMELLLPGPSIPPLQLPPRAATGS
jgi:L-amino acid N-acyltransferase